MPESAAGSTAPSPAPSSDGRRSRASSPQLRVLADNLGDLPSLMRSLNAGKSACYSGFVFVGLSIGMNGITLFLFD